MEVRPPPDSPLERDGTLLWRGMGPSSREGWDPPPERGGTLLQRGVGPSPPERGGGVGPSPPERGWYHPPGADLFPLSYPYDTLISYKKSKKSLEPFSRTSGELICSKQLLATYEC